MQVKNENQIVQFPIYIFIHYFTYRVMKKKYFLVTPKYFESWKSIMYKDLIKLDKQKVELPLRLSTLFLVLTSITIRFRLDHSTMTTVKWCLWMSLLPITPKSDQFWTILLRSGRYHNTRRIMLLSLVTILWQGLKWLWEEKCLITSSPATYHQESLTQYSQDHLSSSRSGPEVPPKSATLVNKHFSPHGKWTWSRH